MKKKKIIVTGAKGTIGSVLRRGLKKYHLTLLDLPKYDLRDYSVLLKIFPGHAIVIHLAWDPKLKNGSEINPDNIQMSYNVYRAAVECKVLRVIMASSVHADDFLNWPYSKKLLTVDKIPTPTSPYGATKVFIEALGRYYAKYHGLEVICIRFGGVNLKDQVDLPEKNYPRIWLSHRDCINLVKRCIETKRIPLNFCLIYGISNNTHRIHDWTNPLGWIPKDNSEDKLKIKAELKLR